MDKTQIGTTTPGQSGPKGNANERVLHIFWSLRQKYHLQMARLTGSVE